MRRARIVVASVAIALLLGEAGLRLLGRFAPPNSPPVERFPGFYRPDPELGYTLWPSRETTYNYPVGSKRQLSLASNADGFRNAREFGEADGRLRIWVLGDSFVLGDGVEAPDRFTEVIERLSPGWRVDNLGMTGWGVDLMIRAFERIARQVDPLKPDVVLLAFYTDDFRRLTPFNAAQGFAFPKFELEDGRLISLPFPQLPAWRRLRIVQAVEQTYWHTQRNRYDLHQALLDRLLAGVKQLEGRLAVAFLPGRGDTDEDRDRRAWLRAWAERARTPFADLTEVIHGAGDAAFLPGNPHWNENGHRIAGEALQSFLRESVLGR